MVFSSLFFLFAFLPVVLCVYFAIPKRYRKARNLWLFLASLFFYSWGEPVYVLIMLFSTFFDYGNGLMLEKLPAEKRKWILLLSLVVNLGILFVFKYTGFFVDILRDLGAGLRPIRLVLPLGISFYTFQTLSYTIDVYRGRTRATRSVIDFGLYVTSFPQLIAGPIVKYIDVERELKDRDDRFASIYDGGILFLRGLFLKVLLANTFGELGERLVFSAEATGLSQLLKLFAYGLQLYFDFAGYSLMAIGLGRVFGFIFPENFRHPYTAQSITEFWTRWHMTLSGWFREYVYIPLGGNRVPVARHIANLFITWMLTGFWHGAAWNYILWGIYYFALLVVEKYLLRRSMPKWPRALRHAYTLFFVFVGWLLFIAEDLRVIPSVFRGIFTGAFADPQSLSLLVQYLPWLAVGALFCTEVPARVFDRWPRPLRHFTYATLFVLAVSMMASGAYNPFLYFRF